MLATTIYILEILTLGLIGLLASRVRKLVKSDPHYLAATLVTEAPETNDSEIVIQVSSEEAIDSAYRSKMESLKHAQIFAGNQLLEVSREYHNLNKELPEWLREAISLYLIGAIDFIGKKGKCENKSRKELISMVLKSNLNIGSQDAEAYFVEAVCREPNSDNDNMVRAGAGAAKAWLDQKIVPETQRLTSQLQNWGVLA